MNKLDDLFKLLREENIYFLFQEEYDCDFIEIKSLISGTQANKILSYCQSVDLKTDKELSIFKIYI